jgi:hypothetical protein
MRRKEAGYRKAPGGVPAFPYFLVLLFDAYSLMKSASTYLEMGLINLGGS